MKTGESRTGNSIQASKMLFRRLMFAMGLGGVVTCSAISCRHGVQDQWRQKAVDAKEFGRILLVHLETEGHLASDDRAGWSSINEMLSELEGLTPEVYSALLAESKQWCISIPTHRSDEVSLFIISSSILANSPSELRGPIRDSLSPDMTNVPIIVVNSLLGSCVVYPKMFGETWEHVLGDVFRISIESSQPFIRPEAGASPLHNTLNRR